MPISTACGSSEWQSDSGTLKKVVDMSDFNTVSFPRASKPHTCVECHCVIEPGTRHARIAGATNGRIWVERECLDCKELSDELWTLLAADNLHPEDGPTFGDLACWIHENVDDERLSPEGRARLKALDERLSTHG
jgi:exosome complex RNA-binding protein Rrp4